MRQNLRFPCSGGLAVGFLAVPYCPDILCVGLVYHLHLAWGQRLRLQLLGPWFTIASRCAIISYLSQDFAGAFSSEHGLSSTLVSHVS